MAHEVSTFLGEAAKVLQIQMEKWFFFLFLILEMVTVIYCKAQQSNALLQYINTYINLCMTCSTISQAAQQHQF